MTDSIASILASKRREIWSLPPDATVYDAIALMAEKGIGAVLVVSGKMLVGILSERDYARKVILQGRSSKDTRVREIMTASLVTVSPDHTVEGCMKIMTENRIRTSSRSRPRPTCCIGFHRRPGERRYRGPGRHHRPVACVYKP